MLHTAIDVRPEERDEVEDPVPHHAQAPAYLVDEQRHVIDDALRHDEELGPELLEFVRGCFGVDEGHMQEAIDPKIGHDHVVEPLATPCAVP